MPVVSDKSPFTSKTRFLVSLDDFLLEAKMSFVRQTLAFFKKAPEVIPVIAVTGVACVMAVGIIGRNYGPNRVNWTVAGRHPELKVQPWENTKLMVINQKFVKPE